MHLRICIRALALAALLLAAPAALAMTWQRVSPLPTGNFLYSVAWANGLFVAVGGSLPGDGRWGTVLTSPDGIAWTLRPTMPPGGGDYAVLQDVLWNGQQWVAVGQAVTPDFEPIVLTSADAMVWEAHYGFGDIPGAMLAVAWKSGPPPNRYIGTGLQVVPHNQVRTYGSSDGVTWNPGSISGTTDALVSLLWDGTKFVGAAYGGAIWTSDTGATWQQHVSGTSNDLYGITLGGGTYVAVGAFGAIQSSSNGTDWTTRGSGVTSSLHDAAWNGQIFVAVGHGNVVLSSPNGAEWHPHPAPPPSSAEQGALNDVVWGGNRWVAVGNFGDILYSDDSMPVELLSFSVE